MTKILLLTGGSGFIGQSILRIASKRSDAHIVPLQRAEAATQMETIRQENKTTDLSLINLAWPSLGRYSASSSGSDGEANDWKAYGAWIDALIDSAADAGIQFFQIGSGVEPYAAGASPRVGDPYLTYGRRKAEIWSRVVNRLPDCAWRLRLHFLFGPGEAKNRLAPSAIDASRSGTGLTLGAPERRRHWLHVDDAASGILDAALSESPENWDICGDTPVSFKQLVNLIGEEVGANIDIVQDDRGLPDAALDEIAPSNVAPFMLEGAGGLDYLRLRIRDYAKTLQP